MQQHERLLLIFGLVVGTVMILITISSAVPSRQSQRDAKTTKTVDEDDGPIVDFQQVQPFDVREQTKRRVRGAKHDKSIWNVDPTDSSDNTVLVDFVDPNLPALPFTKSSAVLLGSITAAKAYLSNDRTGVYSEFSLRIEEVIKGDPYASVTPGCTVEVAREGGRVRFPSGHVHLYKISELEKPRLGGRYVFFLTDGDADQGFQILTAYELRAGKVIPLDKLRQPQTYQNTDQTAFLNELRIRVASN
jgi:hypothetical protein